MNKEEIVRNFLTEQEFMEKVHRAGANSRAAENPESFRYIEIADLTLENKSVIRSDFSYSKISNFNFNGIDFEGTNFDFTMLESVKFSHCHLHRSSFDYSCMRNVIFENCFMDTSGFDFASGEAFFKNTHVHGMELHHTLASVTFKGCAGEALRACYCPALTFYGENCDFHNGEFKDAVFSGEMKNCILSEADFTGSDCTNLYFNNCRMRDLFTDGSTGIEFISGNDDEF